MENLVIKLPRDFEEFYKGKRVVVTGHTGFKGAWLTLWLVKLGADVVGYSLNPPTNPNLFDTLKLNEKITHIIGDIRDLESLKGIFKRYKPNIVFHLAAQSIVRNSYIEPKLTYETNVMGTVNVLEALRTTLNEGSIIIVTSDKCYENKEWVHMYRENDPLGGYDPYSSSKGCAELVTAAYRNSYFNPDEFGNNHRVALATVRAGNVIGGGDWAQDRIIPDCIRSLTNNRKISIRNPNAIRPWQFVLDPLSGYLMLGAILERNGKTFSGSWNFGPKGGEVITVKDLVSCVIEIWGKGEYVLDANKQPYEAKFLALDTNKALLYLGWRPIYRIHDAIKKTIEWYKEYYSNCKDIYEYSLNQIVEYNNKASKNDVVRVC